MMILNDGRSELWQWDTGRKLTVDADCSQVHFSNKVLGRSVDVDVVDGVAIIPDILLQTDKELTAWAFVGTAENGYTKISKTFRVNKRNKPSDYVFTPPEQTTLGELIERLDKIEESQDPDAIKNAVDDYLANNPIEIDETDPTVPSWAKQETKPKYTAEEVGALPVTYTPPAAPVQSVNGKTGEVNLSAADVGALPATTQIPVVPTKVSELENDKGYLTKHQDISGKLDASALPTAINTALAQAKASGEFDGKDGQDGQDGYTPVKGKDYYTEADKREIAKQASEMVDIPEVADAVLVTITTHDEDTYTADTSYATIVQHITQGRIVYAQFGGFLFPFASMLEEEEVGFGATVNGVSILVTICANDSVALSTKELLSEDNKEELVDAVLAALPAAEGAVRYDSEQTLTEEQKAQARENIGAASADMEATIDASVTQYLVENPVVNGMSATLRILLQTILGAGVYTSDQSANIELLNTILANQSAESYAITNNLVFVESDNSEDSVVCGNAYIANLTTYQDYKFDKVLITMGGVNITDSVFDGLGGIHIDHVTADVVITAVAVEQAPLYPLLNGSYSRETGYDGVNLKKTITNGNHVSVNKNTTAGWAINVNISDIESNLSGDNSTNNYVHDAIFAIPAGAFVEVIKENSTFAMNNTSDTDDASAKVQRIFFKDPSGDTEVTLLNTKVNGGDTVGTYTFPSEFEVGSIGLYMQGTSSRWNTGFDLRIYVNGIRYV